jgi:hypothetical protein
MLIPYPSYTHHANTHAQDGYQRVLDKLQEQSLDVADFDGNYRIVVAQYSVWCVVVCCGVMRSQELYGVDPER